MVMDGNPLSSIKNKRDLTCVIAFHMKELKLEGWKHMSYFHLDRDQFKMFQSLESMVKFEIKKQLTLQKTPSPESTPTKQAQSIEK